PKPDLSQLLAESYVEPASELEQRLCELWGEVLRLDRVGVTDNFFAIGGDSILSIQVASRANKAGLPLTVRQLFEHKTVRELARHLSTANLVVAPQEALTGAVELLPIQRLFFAETQIDRHHYNQALLLKTPPSFSLAHLQAIVAALYRRHDALRLCYQPVDGVWQCVYAPLQESLVAAAVVYEDLCALEGDERSSYLAHRIDEIQASLSLADGQLVKVAYFDGGADEGRLLLVIHHLVVDGVSWRILLDDLEQAYGQLQQGQSIQLPAKTSSYQQWSSRLQTYSQSAALQSERYYWLEQLQLPVPELPVDRMPEMPSTQAHTRTVMIELSEALTEALLRDVHKAYRTHINEILLSALLVGFYRWAGLSALRIHLEGHGRESLFEELDTSGTVGWFTSVFPLRLQADNPQALGTVVQVVKEQCRAIPQNGIGYGVLRHLAGDEALIEAEAAGQPEIVFNYLGQFDQSVNEKTVLRPAPEETGAVVSPRQRRTHRLNLNGMVEGGCLRFVLDYSDQEYEAASMDRLARSVEGALADVIEHCLIPGVGSYTPSDFPLARVSQMQLEAWARQYPQLVNLYPATPMQEGMLFHSLLETEQGAYVSQTYLTLKGPINVAAFKAAWELVVARHDALRTVFVGLQEERIQQLVLERVELPWQEADWQTLPTAEQEARFEAYRRQDKVRGFQVGEGPLLRLALWRLGEERYRLLWTFHHALLDGWSGPVLWNELMSAYQQLSAGGPVSLPAPAAYSGFIQWLQRQDKERARAFWRDELIGIEAPTPLSVDRLPVEAGAEGPQEQWLELPLETTQRLQQVARRTQTTLNTVIQGAWAYLLHCYSGEDDVVFGMTVSGRPASLPDVERMVGLFIGTVPVRVSFKTEQPIDAWLQELHSAQVMRDEHSHLGLAEIQLLGDMPRGVGLFDSLVVYENYPTSELRKEREGVSLEVESAETKEESNYKITLAVEPGDQLLLVVSYRAEQFSEETVARLLGHLRQVLQGLAESDGERPVQELPLLAAWERRQLLEEWSGTEAA
ncbi:MAG: condensation domain-containing protein, partial [Pseudomonadota bacterium]|nr:condensation domain-containing protein [Pseudomonadota bacterium]